LQSDGNVVAELISYVANIGYNEWAVTFGVGSLLKSDIMF
jgi:hypothetical protein